MRATVQTARMRAVSAVCWGMSVLLAATADTVQAGVLSVTDDLVVRLMGDAGATYGGGPATEGGLVAQWDDQATALGGNNYAQVNTDARRPRWHGNVLNGHAVLRFDGTKDLLCNGGTWSEMNGDQASWFVVFKSDFSSEQSLVRMNTTTSSVLYGSLVHSTGNRQAYSHARNSGGGWVSANNTDMNVNEFHVLSAVWSADDYIRQWITDNGGMKTAETANATNSGGTFNNFRIGSHDGAGTRFKGDIAEVLVYGAALSAPDRRSVEDYLYTKYFVSGPERINDYPLGNNLRLHATGDTRDVVGTTVFDTAGIPQNGTVQGIVGNPAGILGQALSFSGNDANYVNFSDVMDPGADSLSVSFWFNANDVTTAVPQVMVGKGNSFSGDAGWTMWKQDDTLVVRGRSSTGSGELRFAQQLIDSGIGAGEWHHLAMVIDRDSNTILGYLDGSNEGWIAGGGGATSDSIVGGSVIDTTNSLFVGRRWGAGAPFPGTIDDLAIWDRALSASEIGYLYSKGLQGFNAATVPEPSTWALMALGLLGIVGLRRRTKKD